MNKVVKMPEYTKNNVTREVLETRLRLPERCTVTNGGGYDSVYVFFTGDKQKDIRIFAEILKEKGVSSIKYNKEGDENELWGIQPEEGECWWMVEFHPYEEDIPAFQSFLDSIDHEFRSGLRQENFYNERRPTEAGKLAGRFRRWIDSIKL